MYINIVHFCSKTLGGGGGWEGNNNPVRSSINDQCHFNAKNMIKMKQLEHVF